MNKQTSLHRGMFEVDSLPQFLHKHRREKCSTEQREWVWHDHREEWQNVKEK